MKGAFIAVLVASAVASVHAGVDVEIESKPLERAAFEYSFKNVTISNVSPRLDIHGDIIDGHDGTYRYYEGYYWYHAAEYGLCEEPKGNGCDQTADHCGFRQHNVSIFRSQDLTSGSWEFVGRAVHCSELPNCSIMYRPHIVYNPQTQLWVLYVNFVGDAGYGGNAVYTAPHPAGPFTLVNKQMALARLCPGPAASAPCGPAQGGAGDFDVFVDRDNQAYLIYAANYYMGVELLTPDFTDSTGKNASFVGGPFDGTVAPEYFVEAPVMFERKGVYYALYGHCCCFCEQGSGVIVHTAPHPLGPWSVQEGPDLACRDPTSRSKGFFRHSMSVLDDALGGTPTPGQGCLYQGSQQVSVVKSQQNFVIEVPASNGETQFIWTGDLWQQAPDGIKGHEGQFWAPLKFDDNGRILPMEWVDTFIMEMPISE